MKLVRALGLIDKDKFKDIIESDSHHSDLIYAYIDLLKNLESGFPILSGIKINLIKVNDDIQVVGTDNGKIIPLELYSWQSWLGMSISKKTLNEFDLEFIIVNILYEMTFMGFDDIENQLDKDACLKRIHHLSQDDLRRYNLSVDDMSFILDLFK